MTKNALLDRLFLRLGLLGLLVTVALAACADDDDDNGGNDGGEGALCGGFTGAACADGLFCDYPDDSCGAVDGGGTCSEPPDICTPVVDEVCGCDGKPYNSPCEAQRAGTDVSQSASCD